MDRDRRSTAVTGAPVRHVRLRHAGGWLSNLALLALVVGMLFAIVRVLPGAFAVPTGSSAPDVPAGEIFFDDFAYTGQAGLAANGWFVREVAGDPGPADATWTAGAVELVPGDTPANAVLRLTAATDGTPGGTTQAEVCQPRRFFEGTYAIRIRLTDGPLAGPDGDQLVEAVRLMSPAQRELDPDERQLEVAYLPNGGRTRADAAVEATVGAVSRSRPWLRDTVVAAQGGVLEGWHTIVVRIGNGAIEEGVDGWTVALADLRAFPSGPLSLELLAWFVADGLAPPGPAREYAVDVDWVLHVADRLLSTGEIERMVDAFRGANVSAHDIPSIASAPPGTCPG